MRVISACLPRISPQSPALRRRKGRGDRIAQHHMAGEHANNGVRNVKAERRLAE